MLATSHTEEAALVAQGTHASALVRGISEQHQSVSIGAAAHVSTKILGSPGPQATCPSGQGVSSGRERKATCPVVGHASSGCEVKAGCPLIRKDHDSDTPGVSLKPCGGSALLASVTGESYRPPQMP